MLLREAPTETLAQLQEEMESSTVRDILVQNEDIHFDIERPGGTVTLSPKVTVPMTETGLKAFSQHFDVPYKFVERLDPDMRQYVFTNLAERTKGEVSVAYAPKLGVEAVRDAHVKFINPLRLVEIVGRVIDPSALIVEHIHNNDEFRLDVIAPEGFDRGIGGDRKVGDITRGGLRVGQNLKANQTAKAPWSSEFLYRLLCTNGLEREDPSLVVSARGNSVEQVLEDFEQMADRAFRHVEETIKAFYDLRNQPVENPERALLRMAAEQGIPRATRMVLAEVAPTIDNPTQFDLVNLITNQANDMTMTPNVRRNLQRAGGRVVSEHAERCSHCLAKLN